MTKGIGQRQVTSRTGIAQRQIANRYRPRVATILGYYRKASGSGTITSPNVPTQCEAWLIGGGGGTSSVGLGAGGGSATYKRFQCPPDTAFAYSVGAAGTSASGNSGGDTTFTGLGVNLTAGGGKGSANGSSGGVASGGALNRPGGAGATGSGTGGSGGPGGGAGGAGTSGGGGAAGFGDIISGDMATDLTGGAGSAGGNGTAPGGGAGSTGSGGAGQLVVIFTKMVTP